MHEIEQQLLRYGDLADAERAELERYVRAHPAWAPLLAETRALHALLAHARASSVGVPDVASLAEYVVSRQLDPRPPPAAVRARHARIEAALRTHPELERQARALLRALERVAAEAEDPAAQFERLTGRRLGPPADAAGPGPARPGGADPGVPRP